MSFLCCVLVLLVGEEISIGNIMLLLDMFADFSTYSTKNQKFGGLD